MEPFIKPENNLVRSTQTKRLFERDMYVMFMPFYSEIWFSQNVICIVDNVRKQPG